MNHLPPPALPEKTRPLPESLRAVASLAAAQKREDPATVRRQSAEEARAILSNDNDPDA